MILWLWKWAGSVFNEVILWSRSCRKLLADEHACERMEFKNGENWICLFGPFCLDLYVRSRKDNESCRFDLRFCRYSFVNQQSFGISRQGLFPGKGLKGSREWLLLSVQWLRLKITASVWHHYFTTSLLEMGRQNIDILIVVEKWGESGLVKFHCRCSSRVFFLRFIFGLCRIVYIFDVGRRFQISRCR